MRHARHPLEHQVRKRRVAHRGARDNARMLLDADACWRALATHDTRFDGRFYVGVRSTGVYCRPVCRVRAPKRENCRFYPSAAAAERAGFRPCLRCRPELAPGFAAVDASARIVQAGVALIEGGFLETQSLESLAGRIGVTSRHLRRVFDAELGVSPVEYAQTSRLLLAKRLLTDTSLPVTDIAYASGFASVRRLNALFNARYRMPPTRLRMQRATRVDGMRFMLGYRPPYAFDAVLAFLQFRAIGGVETRAGATFRRALAITHRGTRHAGWISVGQAKRREALEVQLSPSLLQVVPQVLARVRHVFDLACDPHEVAAVLGPLAAREPGMRVPGVFEGFEAGVRAIAGQQVSVRAMTTLLGRIADGFGEPLADAPDGVRRTFPDAQVLAEVAPASIAALGMPQARARSIVALARAVADGLVLAPGVDVPATVERLQALPGIGPWTAQYIAMRALAWPDAFLATDLGVRRALGQTSTPRIVALAERWRPWRAYAVIHLWTSMKEPA
jgi:AraC family transcriptional regulator, regulatory protein of adaptative response / DNA-3-methyladenine glycosylase II